MFVLSGVGQKICLMLMNEDILASEFFLLRQAAMIYVSRNWINKHEINLGQRKIVIACGKCNKSKQRRGPHMNV